MKDLKSFLEDKMGKPGKPDELKKEARGRVLNDFKDAAKEYMGESLGGALKKVTVMAKDSEDLKKGLEKAEEIVEDMPDMAEESESEEMDMEDMQEEDMMSSENKDAKIAMLEEQLSKMQEMLASLKK